MEYDIPWQELNKYFANKANKQDILLVEKWRDQFPINSEIFEQLQKYFNETGTLPIDFNPNTAKALENVSSKISFSPKEKTLKLFPILWKVASVILIFIGAWWLVNQYSDNYQASENMVVISTTNSTQKEIILPDSSHIWLNSRSSIKFPEKFGKTRNVNLEGEAYFEIAHNAEHPFVVNSGNTQTKVLGTKFNLRSYSSEKQVVLTVTNGKVSFGTNEKEKQFFTYSQVGTFNALTGKISKAENINPNFLSWQTHQFYFDDDSLESIFKMLSEVYYFKYHFETNRLKERRLTASFSKRPLGEIMKTIAVSGDVSITLKNGIYTIK